MTLLLLLTFLIACEPSSETSKETENDPIDMSDNNDKSINEELISTESLELDKIQLPERFTIEVFGRVNNARSLTVSQKGTVFIGNRAGNAVYALVDTNGDWKADVRYKLADDMRMPNGVAFKDGDLYVAEVSKLWKFPDIENNLDNPTKELIYDDYPTDGHHGWKYIAFGPDGKLYIPVGAPYNIGESKDEIYASITRMNSDGSEQEVYAHGVRNTVGFTWHPDTGEMWFTDNGRDNIGGSDTSVTDNSPPCELNRITTMGQHFGYPYCHGGTISDPDFGDKGDCNEFIIPAQNLGSHVAPLGVKFGIDTNFPSTYKGKIFIAEHGSWNRSEKIGYRVQLVTESNGVGQSYETFASGWLDDETQKAWGRPVDLIWANDGSMLLSDDLSGTVYRIFYSE